jgi:hypothetical protein
MLDCCRNTCCLINRSLTIKQTGQGRLIAPRTAGKVKKGDLDYHFSLIQFSSVIWRYICRSKSQLIRYRDSLDGRSSIPGRGRDRVQTGF